MKSPRTMQLRPGSDYQTAPAQITTQDMVQQARIVAGGDPVRAAQLLLDQGARQPGPVGDMMIKAGVLCLKPEGEGEP